MTRHQLSEFCLAKDHQINVSLISAHQTVAILAIASLYFALISPVVIVKIAIGIAWYRPTNGQTRFKL